MSQYVYRLKLSRNMQANGMANACRVLNDIQHYCKYAVHVEIECQLLFSIFEYYYAHW